MTLTPVRLGDSVRDADAPSTIKPPEKSLCQNCFHQVVCSAAQETGQIGALIGACPHYFPVMDEEAEARAAEE